MKPPLSLSIAKTLGPKPWDAAQAVRQPSAQHFLDICDEVLPGEQRGSLTMKRLEYTVTRMTSLEDQPVVTVVVVVGGGGKVETKQWEDREEARMTLCMGQFGV